VQREGESEKNRIEDPTTPTKTSTKIRNKHRGNSREMEKDEFFSGSCVELWESQRGVGMKVTVMGPPGSGKTTVVQLLADHYGLTPIKTGEIIISHTLRRDHATIDQTAVGEKLKDFFYRKKDRRRRPPVALVVPLIAEFVRKAEKENPRGWVMERGVREPAHFQAFADAGLLPDKVLPSPLTPTNQPTNQPTCSLRW